MIGAAYSYRGVRGANFVVLWCDFADPACHRTHESLQQRVSDTILFIAVGNIVINAHARIRPHRDEAPVIHDDVDFTFFSGDHSVAGIDSHFVAEHFALTRSVDDRCRAADESDGAGSERLGTSKYEQRQHRLEQRSGGAVWFHMCFEWRVA